MCMMSLLKIAYYVRHVQMLLSLSLSLSLSAVSTEPLGLAVTQMREAEAHRLEL